MRRFFCLLILVTSCLNWANIQAQTISDTYDWEAKPERMERGPLEAGDIELTLFSNRVIDIINEYEMRYIFHIRKRLFEDKAIEQANKVYISMDGVDRFLELKVRVISPKGEVRDIDPGSMKEIENLEGFGSYKIFAVEGLEKGSDLEYMYSVVKTDVGDGKEILQESSPVLKAEIHFSYPSEFKVIEKSYQGLAKMKSADTDLEDVSYFKLLHENMKGLRQDTYGYREPELKRWEYQVMRFSKADEEDRISYNFIGRRLAFILMQPIDQDEEDKAIAKLYKQLRLKKQSTLEQIASIENHIKATYKITDEGDPTAGRSVPRIIENKYGNSMGINRLYRALFQKAEIPFELVAAGSRRYFPIDQDFPSWSAVREVFFYFPREDKFLDPESTSYRIGWLAPEHLETTALFIDPMGVYLESAPLMTRFALIPAPSFEASIDNMSFKVSVADDFESIQVQKTQTYSGYNALPMQPFFDLLSQDEQNEFLEAISKSGIEEAKVLSTNAKHTSLADLNANEPMLVSAEIEFESLLQKAGNKYIVKVGELIGPQVEMYEEKERQLEINFEFPKKYVRKIELTIPEGYEAKGLEKLVMNISYPMVGEKDMLFTSSYQLEGNLLTIDCMEYYTGTSFPKSRIQEFREVINAAADFNKLVVILEKL